MGLSGPVDLKDELHQYTPYTKLQHKQTRAIFYFDYVLSSGNIVTSLLDLTDIYIIIFSIPI